MSFLMPFLTPGIIIAVLGIVLYGLWIAGRELTEFDDLFPYAITGLLVVLVGASIYLAFAVPTFATKDIVQGSAGNVRQDTSNLLQQP